MTELLNFLFSIRGQFNRSEYVKANLILSVAFFIAIVVLIWPLFLYGQALPIDLGSHFKFLFLLNYLIGFIGLGAGLISFFLITIKRLKDMGWSIWLILILVIPIFTWPVILIQCVFLIICLVYPSKR